MDRAVGGTPAPGGPSRIGMVRLRGAAIASMFGADRPVYATPAENIRAAQAAADELDKIEGDERRHMTECVQPAERRPASSPRSRRDIPDADWWRPR